MVKAGSFHLFQIAFVHFPDFLCGLSRGYPNQSKKTFPLSGFLPGSLKIDGSTGEEEGQKKRQKGWCNPLCFPVVPVGARGTT